MQIIQGCILLTVLNITWYKCRPESSFLNQGLVTHIQQQDPFPPMHINSSISQDQTWLLLPEAPRGVFLLLCSSPPHSALPAPCTHAVCAQQPRGSGWQWCNLDSKRDPGFTAVQTGLPGVRSSSQSNKKGTLLWAWKRTSWDQSYCSTGSIFQLDYLACPFNQSWAKRCQPEERKAKLAINWHIAWLCWKPMLCTGSATKWHARLEVTWQTAGGKITQPGPAPSGWPVC